MLLTAFLVMFYWNILLNWWLRGCKYHFGNEMIYICFIVFTASKTKDTAVVDLEKVTFKPKLCTFEEDILEKHGIKEERKYKKKFWY